MKNKLLVMICICFLAVFMLGACGGSSQDSASTDTSDATQTETAEEPGEEILKIEPEYVVVDDDNIKMTVTSVAYKEFSNENEYIVHYTVENKRDDVDISTDVDSDACAVNGYTVMFSSGDSTARPGRINDIATFIANSSFSEGYDHITKLEDMLTFQADVGVTIYKDTGEAHEIQERYVVHLDLNNR